MVAQEWMPLPDEPTALAPDGSAVRVLHATSRGSMAHFEFAAGAVSCTVRHRTVEELWFVVSGTGRMWTSAGTAAGFRVAPGVCVRIPVGVAFQVQSDHEAPLTVIGVTMPPWPGPGEAEIVPDGPWSPTLSPGPG